MIADLVTFHALGLFLISTVVFGFYPVFALRLLLLMYPKDDPIRRQRLADLHDLPYRERPVWVMEQAATCLWEGVALRWRKWRSRKRPADQVIHIVITDTVTGASQVAATATIRGQATVVHSSALALMQATSIHRASYRSGGQIVRTPPAPPEPEQPE